MNNNKITAIIVSAGMSQRMGRTKALIKFRGVPFLVLIIQKLMVICHDIVIVTGYKSEDIQNHTINWILKNNPGLLKRIHWIYNGNFQMGMFTSLQKGILGIKKSDWILYHFVDQPLIPQEFYIDFIRNTSDKYDWIQPVYDGHHGHPLLLSENLISLILKADQQHSLRKISKVKKLRKKFWECNYREILDDFDTPQDLKKLVDKG